MQYDAAFDRLCDDISSALIDLRTPSARTVRAAARATRDLAAALRLAAGAPQDPLWYNALASLARFIEISSESHELDTSTAVRALKTFLEENADVLSAPFEFERAS